MSIIKAFILTFLLVSIKVAIELSLGEFSPDTHDIEEALRFYSIISIASYLITYLFLFFFMAKMKLNNGIEKYAQINVSTLLLVLLLGIGLHLIDRALFDFEFIYKTIVNIAYDKYNLKFEGFDTILFYRSIGSLIMAPICEELFFRKYLFKGLLKKNNFTVSIFVSSLCFALTHIDSPRNIIPTFIF